MDEEKLKALLKEATAHCYDEEDELWGIFSALMAGLSLPLEATMQGEAVTLVGLDGHTSAPEVGVMARVQKGGAEEAVALADVEATDLDSASAEWLAVHRYWLSKSG